MSDRKPDHERVRRASPELPWVDLPAEGRATWPECPGHLWEPGEAWWNRNWSTPAATQWGSEEHDLAVRRGELQDLWDRERDTKVLAEMRHLEAALGLTAKARKELRWRIVEAGEVIEMNGQKLSNKKRFKIVGSA